MKSFSGMLCLAVLLCVQASLAAEQASEGLASWYGENYRGKTTASGESFDPDQLTAAHRTISFGREVRVTRLDNGSQVTVRINDRGPSKRGRVIDLSRAAAERLGIVKTGLAQVRIEVLDSRGPMLGAAVDDPQGSSAAQNRN